jgi:hypothetical protein
MVDQSEQTRLLETLRNLPPEPPSETTPVVEQLHRIANGIEDLKTAIHAQSEILLSLSKEFRDRPVPEFGAQARRTGDRPAPPLRRWS